MTEQDIINAYVWIRKNNNTIPDDVLDFINRSAIHALDSKWIKIESEKDLPKSRGSEDVWVYCEEGGVCIASTKHLNDPEISRYWMKTVSHYQPIQKPEPPLF